MAIKETLLDAITPHVAFDGWSPEAFAAAMRDAGVTQAEADYACPRGAIDLAIAYHMRGDAQMVAAMGAADLADMRYSEKVAHAIWLRLLAAEDKEVVRRGSTLFALPHMAPEGAKLIWGTADAIWTALGDTSDDLNWYTKRATLSAVYGSVVLYWLGDDSVDGAATRDFIDRRIANVMQFEKAKAQARENKLFNAVAGPLARMAEAIKAPAAAPDDLPGQWRDGTK